MTEPLISIVIIPARGGSKRFPRKNIAPLMERPLLSFAIHAGLRADHISEVFVSTDDAEIADIAQTWGARVPYIRPDDLATDHATADEAVAHMVNYLRVEEGAKIDIVVLIQPTSPFVLPEHIDQAILMLTQNPDIDSVTTLSQLDHRLHPYNLSSIKENGEWEFILPEKRAAAKTRQSKPATYQFSNLFAARADTMLSMGRFGKHKGAVIIDDVYAWDIDHEWQLKTAEYMLKEGIVDLGPLPEKRT